MCMYLNEKLQAHVLKFSKPQLHFLKLQRIHTRQRTSLWMVGDTALERRVRCQMRGGLLPSAAKSNRRGSTAK